MRITLYAIPVLSTTSPRNPDHRRQKWPKTAGKWAKNRHNTKTRCYCWGWVSTLGKLSNQAGSGAGGGLYSTPTTTDKKNRILSNHPESPGYDKGLITNNIIHVEHFKTIEEERPDRRGLYSRFVETLVSSCSYLMKSDIKKNTKPLTLSSGLPIISRRHTNTILYW